MSDILILCLPADASAAGAIVDGIDQQGNSSNVRFRASAPDDSQWAEVEQLAATCPCVIFCWSAATGADDAEPMRQLASRTLADGRAICVELAAGSRPAGMAAASTYPLYARRSLPGTIMQFVFGRAFVTQIVAAAREKVIGRDPPPPGTFWRLVRWQAWVAAGALAFAVGTGAGFLQFYRDPEVAKWLDLEAGRAFASARDTRSCDAMRGFVERHAGSAWAADAGEWLATCTVRDFTVVRRTEQPLELYAASDAEARREAERLCARSATVSAAKVVAVEVEPAVRAGDYEAICTLDQRIIEQRETMGSPMPKL